MTRMNKKAVKGARKACRGKMAMIGARGAKLHRRGTAEDGKEGIRKKNERKT